MEHKDTHHLRYRDAGVDIDAANRLLQDIAAIAKTTHRPGVVAGVGGFGALFELPTERYRHPVLVSGTDGVGTKLRLAIDAQAHHGIGIDLVAMCANDILVHGAEPLYFLDYFATGQLNPTVAGEIIQGIAHGCEQAGAALIGGETAEMPGMYHAGDYDLAGFCVGVVERDRIIDGRAVAPGDVVIGLASSGPHANGYSLIRKILEVTHTDLTYPLGGAELGELLLEPTRIYVRPILKLLEHIPVHAIAHITGGGLMDNIPRVLPQYCHAHIHPSAWTRPAIFDWLQRAGGVQDSEMYRTFNCGIGLVLCVPPSALEQAMGCLQDQHSPGWVIGTIKPATDPEPRVIFA